MIGVKGLVGAALALLLPLVAYADTVIRGAGASFPANLYAAWIERFETDNPDIRVDFDAVGSGEGMRRFQAGEVDFGATDRPMDDARIAAVEGGVLHVPTTAGMVVLAYNLPDHRGDLRLSRETLARIFAGEITEWSDPAIAADNPGVAFPDRTIALVTRRDSSGTTFIFSTFLDRASPAWSAAGFTPGTLVSFPRAMTVMGNDGVAGRLAITEYSLGYVEYSFARQLDLAVATVENRAGDFVAPTEETGREALAGSAGDLPEDGRAIVADAPAGYPIIGYSWALLPAAGFADPGIADGVRRFFDFGLGPVGQAMAEPIGYVALPEPAAQRARAILALLP